MLSFFPHLPILSCISSLEQVKRPLLKEVKARVERLKWMWSEKLSAQFIVFFVFLFFLAALGLPCCTQAFSSCGEWGLLFLAVCGLLIAVAEHRL